MNILIANDDGIDHIGLKELVKALSEYGDVYVTAPEGERSSNSHHLTIHGLVRFEEREVAYAKKAYALWGTPADCVLMGLEVLFKDQIDLVVSGINNGANVSTDIIYSGTIAAARQAYFAGVPSVALSLLYDREMDYAACAKIGSRIAMEYYKSAKKNDYFLNVNIPNLPEEKIKGIRVCSKSGNIAYNDSYEIVNEDGKNYIRILHSDLTYDQTDDPQIDYNALRDGYISVSPLKNDHIDLEHLEDVGKFI